MTRPTLAGSLRLKNDAALVTGPHLGLVVDIGPDGEIVPRWRPVSLLVPVSRGNPGGPILQLGLAAN